MTRLLTHPVRASSRAGFTLAEILVSILIFTIVSLAMVTILLTSTNVFRAGEYGRASTDEAISALGIIDDDLKRMVPEKAGGFFCCRLFSGTVPPAATPPNGNCAVAFLITDPDPDAITISGEKARKLAVYWVTTVVINGVDGSPHREEQLYRALSPIASEDDEPGPGDPPLPPTVLNVDVVNRYLALQDPSGVSATAPVPLPNCLLRAKPVIIARNCLHFSVWVSNANSRRQPMNPTGTTDNWLKDTANIEIAPTLAGADYCTETVPGFVPDPFPMAVRFSVTLASGRYGPSGYVIEDQNPNIRIAGVQGVPTVPGAMVRIDDEWVQYRDYVGGVLQVDPAMRGARRSTMTTHLRNAPVRLGQSYTLVRTFAH